MGGVSKDGRLRAQAKEISKSEGRRKVFQLLLRAKTEGMDVMGQGPT